jgi:hypothetical protein
MKTIFEREWSSGQRFTNRDSQRANSQSLKESVLHQRGGARKSSVAIGIGYGERLTPGLERRAKEKCRRLGHLPERFDGKVWKQAMLKKSNRFWWSSY